MSEPDPTGYRDSPDTTDPAGSRDAGSGQDAPLTTDPEAQREDSVMRPGNEPD